MKQPANPGRPLLHMEVGIAEAMLQQLRPRRAEKTELRQTVESAFEELALKYCHCNHSRMAMHDRSIELHIDYDNGGGTFRRVSVFGHEWNGKETAVAIHGFCHLRSRERSFNSRKIVHCVNLAENREIGDKRVSSG
jgi:hypothetical protein